MESLQEVDELIENYYMNHFKSSIKKESKKYNVSCLWIEYLMEESNEFVLNYFKE
jgi:hypothetical protein